MNEFNEKVEVNFIFKQNPEQNTNYSTRKRSAKINANVFFFLI